MSQRVTRILLPCLAVCLVVALGAYTLNPLSPTSLLRTYVPSSMAEFTDQLQSAGISSAEISRLVHS